MANDKDENKPEPPKPPTPPTPPVPPKKRRVEVLVDNLGPQLLQRGDITDAPGMVRLLDTPGGERLVQEVR